jgi:DNA repair protein RecO (recombination protein O)
MVHRIEEALVLRAIDFGESDRIVHLLTPQSGRINAIAKGAKRSVRRFPGTLDLFNHLRVQIARRRAATLARLEHTPEGGARGEAGPVFEFGRAALEAIESRTPDERLRIFIELRALDALGLRPELRRCTRCGEPVASDPPAGFHVSDGGPVCGRCRAPAEVLLPVHLGTLRALEQGLRFDLDRLDRLTLGREALAQAREILARFQRFHLGIELRSERFLNEILRSPPVRTA